MATVYDLDFGIAQGRFSPDEQVHVMTLLCSLILIDGDDDDDEWVNVQVGTGTAILGNGRGIWTRKASTRAITFFDDDGTTKLAQLTYSTWPLRYMDYGKVHLFKPLRGGGSQATNQVDLDYLAGRVR